MPLEVLHFSIREGSLPLLGPLLGFGFGSAGMLWFLAAGAAPLLIHLWNKRKHREVRWAAMEYLLAAIRNNSRRIRIEQLILLAVRTLMILLLALAVAEPFLEQIGLSMVAGRRTHKVIVIDGSFSMAYRPTDKSRFDRARDLARQIVEESSLGDGFTMVLMSQPPRVVVGTPVFEPGSFVEEIDNLRLPHGGGDLSATITKVEEILSEARRDHKKLTQEEVYFLTDLGRTSWAPRQSPAARAAFLRRSKQLASSAAITVIDLGQSDSENLAVTDLRLAESFATVGRDVTALAKIENFGRQAKRHQLVEFLVDDRRAGEDYVDLEAGGNKPVAFTYRFDAPGDHTVEIRLAPDQLDIDNHRWFAMPVAQRLRVLCINGRPSGDPFGGATDYLAVALEDAADVEVAMESAIQERELASYDAVFLCNVGQFNRGEARQLRDYLKRGGGLVFFLGDRVQADSYNQRLLDDDGQSAILPAKLGRVLSMPAAAGQYLLDPRGYKHPILHAFRDNEQVGFLTTPIYKYFQLTLPKDKEPVLAFTNGDALIVADSVGQGRSILVATSAGTGPKNDIWTVMQMRPNYLPLVHALLAAAVEGQAQSRNTIVGQTLLGQRPRSGGDAALRIATPQGTLRQVRVTSTGDGMQWSFSATDESGVYQARYEGTPGEMESFAVNIDPVESDLAKLELDELRNDVWNGVPFVSRTNWQNLDDRPEVEISRRDFLYWWLLCGVAALLFVETFLAWLFGRRAA